MKDLNAINHFIDINEEIKFIGTFNRFSENFIVNPGDTKFSGTGGVPAEIAGICGYNFINFSYHYAETDLIDSPRFIFANYSLISVENFNKSDSKVLGNCVFEGSTPTNSKASIADPIIVVFGVTAGIGIYKGITKVIIDYRIPQRVLYFITNKVKVLTN